MLRLTTGAFAGFIAFLFWGDMASVFDVAAYILERQCPQEGGTLTTWKLQKLVYYAKAWSAVWDDKELFPEPIQAWANGPVCPSLYEYHRGQFKISELIDSNGEAIGDSSKLDENERDSVDHVLEFYGPKSAQYLSELTHSELPWKQARKGLSAGERGNATIPTASMAEYYGSL